MERLSGTKASWSVYDRYTARARYIGEENGLPQSSADKFIVSGSITQQNMFGTGNALTLAANSGSVNKTYALSFTDPYYTVDGVSRGFDLYDRRFDPRTLSLGSYKTETLGGGVRFGYPLSEVDRLNFGLAFERTNITIFDDSPQRFKDFVDKFGTGATALITTLGWARDGRDSALWPTTGVQQRLFTEGAVPGAELRYYKVGYDASWFYPITRNYTLRLGGEIGTAGGYGGQPLPFYKSYYAGGVQSVRGYYQSSLGPKDANGVLGGSRKAIGSIEILFPFPGIGQDRTVRLGTFLDAGQVWTPGNAGSTLNELGWRYSTGLSFSWISPIGPLRLSFAMPLHTREGDRIQRFQFLLGTVF